MTLQPVQARFGTVYMVNERDPKTRHLQSRSVRVVYDGLGNLVVGGEKIQTPPTLEQDIQDISTGRLGDNLAQIKTVLQAALQELEETGRSMDGHAQAQGPVYQAYREMIAVDSPTMHPVGQSTTYKIGCDVLEFERFA